MIARALAVITLGLLAYSLLSPVHDLGDTAVYGQAYLWGESSTLVYDHWFADNWEIAQHALFLLTTIGCFFTLSRPHRIALPALTFALLIPLAFQRAIAGDGVKYEFFDAVKMWAVVLVAAAIVTIFRKPPSRLAARDPLLMRGGRR